MNCAAAEITFVDRESNIRRAYTYPVTRVILKERDSPEYDRVFIVDIDGKWYEEK